MTETDTGKLDQWRQQDNERIQREVDRYNASPGLLNTDHPDAYGNTIRADGIDCPRCLNKGHLYVVQLDERGNAQRFYQPCECLPRRWVSRKLTESGLRKAVGRCTFESFHTDEPFQRRMLDIAKRYVSDGIAGGAWLYAGGQSGSGKSHICTAVAGALLMRERELRYMVWPHEARKIKAMANDAAAYDQQVEPLRTVEVLYIDDFLKPVRNNDGGEAVATAADVKLAFDIINSRYVAGLHTIISSEWFSNELGAIDEALAGRICEMSGKYRMDIARKPERNYRNRADTI